MFTILRNCNIAQKSCNEIKATKLSYVIDDYLVEDRTDRFLREAVRSALCLIEVMTYIFRCYDSVIYYQIVL